VQTCACDIVWPTYHGITIKPGTAVGLENPLKIVYLRGLSKTTNNMIEIRPGGEIMPEGLVRLLTIGLMAQATYFV